MGFARGGGVRAHRALGGSRGRRGGKARREPASEAKGVRGAETSNECVACPGRRASAIREVPARSAQVPAMDRLRGFASQDRYRKDSTLQPSIGRRMARFLE